MSSTTRGGSVTAEALRDVFDAAFAAPPIDKAHGESLLAIRVAGDPYALRLSEVAGVYRDRKVVPVGVDRPDFLGIAGFRGELFPIFDLGALLGYGPPAAISRWIVLTRAPSPIGLSFERLEAHVQVAADKIFAPDADRPSRLYTQGAVHAAGAARPIVHLASAIDAIARRAAPLAPPKER